jgi:hypothetical protein
MRYVPFILALGGCVAGMGYSTLDQVTNAAREYNNDVRWGRFAEAAKHVPSDSRQRFVDRHSSLENDLEIADYELVSIDVDRKRQSASARVDYTWALKSRGIVEKTTTKQRWERRDSDWILAAEARVKGAPLILFDEPSTASTSTDK